jgi:hypothetical protein
MPGAPASLLYYVIMSGSRLRVAARIGCSEAH